MEAPTPQELFLFTTDQGHTIPPNSFTGLHISSDSSSSPVQTANGVTPRELHLLGRLRGVVLNNNERNNEEENRHAGIDTDLSLSSSMDRHKIIKTVTESDCRKDLSRLLLPLHDVKTHVLQRMDEETAGKVKNGLWVVVTDIDANKDHRLVFRYWESSNSYVLNRGWFEPFVEEGGLKPGDEIGIFWDEYERKFYFTVHRRAPPHLSNTAG